ncbi:hypothetical protein L218DRAFT_959960 [Marasmius fiardii PR-910]|nr:hypothetical protein L218DRAFT_959960 [Marasmius fiardii PR-910]
MKEDALEISICRNFDDLRSFLSSSTTLKVLQEGLQINEGWTATSIVEWLQEEIRSPTHNELYRKRCTKCLNALVKKYYVFPTSFFCDSIIRDGDYPLGGGGFADVYKGFLGSRAVCLKVLRVHTQTDEKKRKKMVENFCQEALIWTQLSHPNVLQLLGVNTTLFKTDFCLVSPWMTNGDIITFLERTPNHDRLQSILEIAAGLEYLHSLSPMIVHGDIRGANILVDEVRTCRLADFGLSREAPGTTMIETSTGMKGSLRWMAPEMLKPSSTRESNEDRSPRDVYAYACTILEIMTGKPPFSELHDIAVITEVLFNRGRPARPTGVLWCPDDVWALVEKCWDEDHHKRPRATYVHSYLTGLIRPDKGSGADSPDRPQHLTLYPTSIEDPTPGISQLSLESTGHEILATAFPNDNSATEGDSTPEILTSSADGKPTLSDSQSHNQPHEALSSSMDGQPTQLDTQSRPHMRARSKSLTQYFTKLVSNAISSDDLHRKHPLETSPVTPRPSLVSGAKSIQSYFTKLAGITRSLDDLVEDVPRPPSEETPEQAYGRKTKESNKAKRVSDVIDRQLRNDWRNPRDDPFEEFLRPPPNEAPEQAFERIRREAEAKRVSDAIDAQLRDEWKKARDSPLEDFLTVRPPPNEGPEKASGRIAQESKPKRESGVIGGQVRNDWRHSRDDPFEKFLRPPPNETPEQALKRIQQEAEAKRVSDAIDEELRKERVRAQVAWKGVSSLLLLGQAGSGKTTVLKTLVARYDRATWDKERSIWCMAIQLNIIDLLLLIIRLINTDLQDEGWKYPSDRGNALPTHQFTPHHGLLIKPLEPLLQFVRVFKLQHALAEHISSSHLWLRSGTLISDPEPRDISTERSIIEDAVKVVVSNRNSVKALWGDKNVQHALALSRRMRTFCGDPGFYLEHLDRITSADYSPTDEDIIHAYLPTSNHQDYKFPIDSKNGLRITDVAGSREQYYQLSRLLSEENYSTVIFLCPISTFNEVLDEGLNRLEDSLRLWGSICSNMLLSSKRFILFLNKYDVLQEKIERGIPINQFIPSYGDRPNTCSDFANYISGQMKKTYNAWRHSQTLHTFITTATDTVAFRRTLEETITKHVHDLTSTKLL